MSTFTLHEKSGVVLEHRHEAEADEGTNHAREVILGAPGGALPRISDIKGQGQKLEQRTLEVVCSKRRINCPVAVIARTGIQGF